MAEPSSSGEVYEANQVNQLLQCPICMERFMKPKVLPCQHPFCEGCLERLQMRRSIIKCPVCRVEHSLPNSRVSDLPTNLIINQLLDLTPATVPTTRVSQATMKKSKDSLTIDTPENKYKDKSMPLFTVGRRGNSDREFERPRGLFISKLNQIFVADSDNARVQVFDDNGQFLKRFQCAFPDDGVNAVGIVGLAQNEAGDVFVTDCLNHRVLVFNQDYTFKLRFGRKGQGNGEFNCPWGIIIDGMGRIYVCDKDNHRIQVVEANGAFVKKFGECGKQAGQFQSPYCIALSTVEHIYISDTENHRIQSFSRQGTFLFTFGAEGRMQGELSYPKGIAIDAQGFVIVGDNGNNRIQVFRGDGRFFCMFGRYGSNSGQVKGIEGIGLQSNGRIVVGDRENHRVQVF